MRILITGATGFIGSNLFDTLSKKYKVVGLARSNKININHVEMDMSKKGITDNLKGPFDVIIHCASILANNENHKDLDLFYKNIRITESLLSLISKFSPKMIINFSTIGVYPNIDGDYKENSLIKPSHNFEGLYGLSKFCSEEILEFFLKNNFKTRLVNLRLGQTIGSGMREDRIYSKMKLSLKKNNVIDVYAKGERTSAFVTIEYLTNLIQKIITDKLIKGTFNVAEFNFSYKELAKMLIDKYGDSQSVINYVDKGNPSKVKINTDKLKFFFSNE